MSIIFMYCLGMMEWYVYHIHVLSGNDGVVWKPAMLAYDCWPTLYLGDRTASLIIKLNFEILSRLPVSTL